MENQARTPRHEVLLAAAILAALQKQRSETLISIEYISSLLFELKKEGVDLGEIALRRVPGGFYSEDVETFIGHYLAAGYAEQYSPVKFTAKGKEALAETIAEERKENPNVLKEIESILGKLAA